MDGILFPVVVMGGLGVIFGALLAFASQKFAVEVDPRQTQIRALLPGANCGGCGFPGCDGYAEACVTANAKPNLCAAGGPEVAAKIAEILGVTAEASEPMVAYVRCQGALNRTVKDCVYQGFHDCREAVVVPGKGPDACSFGCLGFGTCVKVCAFGAISVKDGLAVVDRDKCVACGACVAECPKGVIALIPKKELFQVGCSNPLKGPFVKKVCSIGCIGCGICVKACPKQAIELKDALASIDPAKCVNCGLCEQKCPVHAITDARSPEVKAKLAAARAKAAEIAAAKAAEQKAAPAE